MAPGSLNAEEGAMAISISMEGMTETQQLCTLKNQVKIQTDMYNEKVSEMKKQSELIERLKRQHENLREQINRVDKENIKLKKKIEQDNLNKQQQYLQDPQNYANGMNYYQGGGQGGLKVIQKKVDVSGGGFFSTKVFTNDFQQQNNNQFSPNPLRNQDYRNNTNKRGISPTKRVNTQVNTYEYSGKNQLINYDAQALAQAPRPVQGTEFEFKKKRVHGLKSIDFTAQIVENPDFLKNKDSQESTGSNKMSNKMQKIQLGINN